MVSLNFYGRTYCFSFLSSEVVTKVSRFVVPHISEIVLPSPSGSSSPQRVAAADKRGASYRSLWCGWKANRQHSDMLWVGPRYAGWDMHTIKLHGSVRRWVLPYSWCANWACVLLVGMQRSTERDGNSLVRGNEWIILNIR